ncbi:putative RNA recognition motif domain, nucleotide-binding alpha-beta plait domain superfamily [Helianthus annuus]|nr:putative RNA recognition motif domain, nucleotide-binding alpha-beta plait domain superfamily [Helianthus annuus]
MDVDTGWGGDDIGGDGPWNEVNYQKQRKSRGNGVEMTFIIQNLPNRTTKMVLWRAFQPYGFVSDAYVARKKDKRGNCFGFVRYIGVENVDLTLVEMNKVKIFEAKVSVSLAKFDKNHKRFIYTSKIVGEKVWRPKEPAGMAPPVNKGGCSRGATVQEGRSYASLFSRDGEENNAGSKVISISGRGSKYPLHCINRSIHGVVKDLYTLNNLQSVLSKGGLSGFGLSYVGGLSILLTLGDAGRVKEVMSNNLDCLARVFSRFHIWKGEDLPSERVVSLRISGVPVHLRDGPVYDQIVGLFGMVVQESSFSWVDTVNSEGSVLVLVPLGRRIEETVVVSWENRRFVVWVAEEVAAWKPEMDGDISSTESDHNSPEKVGNRFFEGGDNNDGYEEDEVEEGEVRSLEIIRPTPVTTKRSSSEPLLEPVCEKSPEVGKVETVKMLHEVHGESSIPMESINVSVGPEVVAAGCYDRGPQDQVKSGKC